VKLKNGIQRSSFNEQLKDKWRTVFYIATAIIVMIGSLFAWWFGEDTAPMIFIGGICGLIGHWIATTVSSLKLPKSKRIIIIDYLETHRYDRMSNGVKYVPKIHRLLRFDSQDVHLYFSGNDELEIRGAYYVLKKINQVCSA
jgi:hypothetical protein